MSDLQDLNRPVIDDLMADVVDTLRENTKRVDARVTANANEIVKKADKTYVDTEFGKKADKTYVDSQDNILSVKTDEALAVASWKADKTYVDTELGKKADGSHVHSNYLTNLSIGTVSVGAAAVAISGTAPTQTLSFVVPQGPTGAQGLKGDTGATGPAGSAATIDGQLPNWRDIAPGDVLRQGIGLPHDYAGFSSGSRGIQLDGRWQDHQASGTADCWGSPGALHTITDPLQPGSWPAVATHWVHWPDTVICQVSQGWNYSGFYQKMFHGPEFTMLYGSLTVLFSAVQTTSDRRKKSDFAPLDNPLERLEAFDGWEYTLIDSGERAYGVIAQDTQKTMPHSVSEHDGVMSQDYNAIVALLVNAVKALKAEVRELKARLEPINLEIKS